MLIAQSAALPFHRVALQSSQGGSLCKRHGLLLAQSAALHFHKVAFQPSQGGSLCKRHAVLIAQSAALPFSQGGVPAISSGSHSGVISLSQGPVPPSFKSLKNPSPAELYWNMCVQHMLIVGFQTYDNHNSYPKSNKHDVGRVGASCFVDHLSRRNILTYSYLDRPHARIRPQQACS